MNVSAKPQPRASKNAEAIKMQDLAVNMVRAASRWANYCRSHRDIAERYQRWFYRRNQVIMDRAIKTLGLAETRIRLHPEVSVTVIVNIARSLAEAETQLKTGVAVTGENATDDVAQPEVKAVPEAASDLTSEKAILEATTDPSSAAADLAPGVETTSVVAEDSENDQAAD